MSKAKMHTTQGTIELELFDEDAPKTVSNFRKLASDGFYPYPDSVEVAARAGVRAIVEPGGSVKDSEAIAAADAAGLAMVFTGERHFKH